MAKEDFWRLATSRQVIKHECPGVTTESRFTLDCPITTVATGLDVHHDSIDTEISAAMNSPLGSSPA
jgi:hypothetical protein